LSHNFHIYRSSAGSGKTYTLALSFIALALKGDRYGYEDYYRKILAITFTNKAASEMKERVLEYLDSLSKKKDADGILDWLKKETSLDKDTIFQRSAVIHKHILHNYADLGISTIDKFTYKIVRTFASDLGLSHNFDLEMDNYKIIQPAVALLLSKMSDAGGPLSNALVNFAIQKAEDGKSTNIERDLEEFAQQLFKEEVARYTHGKILTVESCMQVKKDLQKNKQDLILRIKDLADRVCLFFDMNGLTKNHFKSGTFYNHFTQKLGHDDDSKWCLTPSLQQNITNNDWYSKSAKQDSKDLVDLLEPQLVQFIDELMILLTEYYSVKAVLKNIYAIAVLNELMKEVKEFKKENNIEQISEFNKKIHDVVTNQPSSFIYERLGERYNHYLIDEFQDTSLLQWQNILPLITDSLDFGKSMLVGDGKQSIYRWRGGEVEQFSKLPQIFKGDNLAFKSDWESKLQDHYVADNLQSNYRSRKNIIEFNNQFFENTKELLSADLRTIYDKGEQSSKQAKDGGYVYIDLFGDKENDFKELILQKMTSEIKKITTLNNYAYKDITILCNSRKNVALVAENLSENGIPVISNEGLLLSKSDKVNILIAILRYLQNKTDDISKVVIAEYVWKYSLSNEDIHQIHLEIMSSEGFFAVLKRANIHINRASLLQEPLYELVEQVIRLFNFEEDVYLGFFLDVVLSYTEKKGSSISEFLHWWKDRVEKEAIVIPDGTDAVQIMTIHKSKGLAFDVVMIPFNWEDRKKTSDIWVDTSKYFNKQLPAALIGGSAQLELSFFKANYQKERDMSLLDSLNKLYVAMTRPKERLYIFSKYFPNSLKGYEKKENLNSFLYKYDGSFPIASGDPEMMHQEKKNIKDAFQLTKRRKVNWKDVISLKHTAEEIWDTETANTKRDWGKLLHLVLSKISYSNQKDEVINKMYKLGKFTSEDYQELQNVVADLLNHEEIKPFFTDDWEVKNEKEILMNNGRTYIPDRLLFSKITDKVVIIDYKTGKELDKHESQITDYANALMLMGSRNVERILIYTSETIKVVRL
jgi:ATP-dependent exoDNAse (exonuclease V) beta subunit